MPLVDPLELSLTPGRHASRCGYAADKPINARRNLITGMGAEAVVSCNSSQL